MGDTPSSVFPCRTMADENAAAQDTGAETYWLRTHAQPGPSRRLAKTVVQLLGDTITDAELLYSIDLALSEACANVVRHAYTGVPQGDVEVVVKIYPNQRLEVEVADWGIGFPSWPVTVQNAQPEAEGGRGLVIMSKLSDFFECRQDGARNSVFMRMDVPQSKWAPQWDDPSAPAPSPATGEGAQETGDDELRDISLDTPQNPTGGSS